MAVSNSPARNMRFIVLVTTDFLLNLHPSPFEFDFSRVTIFGLIKFRHLGAPIRRMVGMIIPTTVSSVTKAEQHGLQGFCVRSQLPPLSTASGTKTKF